MSAKNNEYIYLAFLTEPRQVGEKTKRSPQHLTLVPPFPAISPLSKLKTAVKEVAAETKPVKAKIAKEARWGPRRNIDVFLVEPVDVIAMLHYQLMHKLESIGISVPTNYVREAFLPHIRVRPAHTTEFKKGQMIDIDHIAIMHKDKGYRTMLAKEELRGE